MKQIEIRTQSSDISENLQARIEDPLWLLARQWQLGEFKADDAGSPVGAQALLSTSHVNRIQLGNESDKKTVAFDFSPYDTPLEAVVEREPTITSKKCKLLPSAADR